MHPLESSQTMQENHEQTSQRHGGLPQTSQWLSESNLYDAIQCADTVIAWVMFQCWLSYLLTVTFTSLSFHFSQLHEDKNIYLAGLLLRFKKTLAQCLGHICTQKIFLLLPFFLPSCHKENHNILSLFIPTFYHSHKIHSLCL